MNWGYDCPLTVSPPVDFPGFTPQAQRIIKNFASGAGTPQSEDCLTLNVWTRPTPQSQRLKKPVLVFFYGGRFTIGNTDSPFYNGKYFAAAQDVVVITLNYRMNIFGFPGAPNNTQNIGLRDQRLAVEWVRDNVDAFGGDSSKITIFGQSSGGVAVDYWSYTYTDDPIVSGLISHSGNAFSFPLNTPEAVLQHWYNISAALGCGSTGNTVPCLRQKNWTDIKAAAAKIAATPGGSPLRAIPPFYPSVDNELVFSDYENRSEAGSFAKLPYLLGNNNNEQAYYAVAAFGQGRNVTKAQGHQFLLESFTCPNNVEAVNRRNVGVPAWQFRYFGDWDNIRLYNTSGAYHGSDLEMIFGASEDVSGIPPSEPERETTKLMQRFWAAFADDPRSGLSRMGWPEFDPDSESLMRLAHSDDPMPSLVRPDLYASACSTVTLGALRTSAATDTQA